MKLKPLGRKLAAYQIIALISLAGLPVAFALGWPVVFCICLVAFIVSESLAVGICIDANYAKYGLFGFRRGPDQLVEYEPKDKEYEAERQWQDND